MTEARKWTAGAVAIALLIVAASWFLLISPKRAEVADLNAQTDAQQDTNSELQVDLEVLKQENKNLPEKQAELAALRTKIPETSELPSYVRDLQDLGTKSGVAFTSLTPAAPVGLGDVAATTEGTAALTPGSLAAINVDMVVTGGYFEIVDFVNELETASRYTLIGGYSISSEEAAEDESTAGGPSPLTATLNARIYLVPSAEATGFDATTDPDATSTAP